MILLSKSIFTGTSLTPVDGFVAVEGNKIKAVGTREESTAWCEKDSQVIDLGDKTVVAGFTDCHTFFTGYILRSLGVDFSEVHTDKEAVSLLKKEEEQLGKGTPLFGHCFQKDSYTEMEEGLLDREFPDTPVVVFTFDRDTCLMNRAARKKYQFGPEKCYAEMIYRMMPDYLSRPDTEERFLEYVKMLNERGVTTIKEMTFDTSYGVADIYEKLEKEHKLNMRISFMSQPVGEGINIPYGKEMRERFTGEFVKFGGYNRMTDRSIGSGMAELLEPYASTGVLCDVPVEWELITRETLEADASDFRYSLHCQGDGAIRHTVELFDKCQKVNGKLKNRHAITDLEYSHPADLEAFGKMGGIAEVYAQIQSFDTKESIEELWKEKLGGDRGKNYWNRRKMWDSGICVTCGTDLPLLIPDIPEAIWCSCGGHMADGTVVNKENMLTIPEMLLAWTKNGQYNCYNEERLGTLEAGKLADIAVIDTDVFTASMDEIKNASVCLTISDGRIVYRKEEEK